MADALTFTPAPMRVAFAAISLIMATGVSGPSHASTPEEYSSSPAFKTCVMRSGGVTAKLKACLSAEYRLRDRTLNQTYRSVMKQLGTQALRIRLRESQRVWLRQRDGNCQLAVEKSARAGGTAAALLFDDCLVQHVGKRILWLRKVPANPGYLSKV